MTRTAGAEPELGEAARDAVDQAVHRHSQGKEDPGEDQDVVGQCLEGGILDLVRKRNLVVEGQYIRAREGGPAEGGNLADQTVADP